MLRGEHQNFSYFLRAALADKIDGIELNEILLNGIPNSWYKQVYVQGFDFESISLKKAVNMFERMEIAESIYKGVVEPSYFKNIPGHIPKVISISGIG